MTPNAINRIKEWQKQLTQAISFKIICSQKHLDDPFYAFGKSLESQSSYFDIHYQDAGKDLPEIKLTDNLHFHALPEGTELEPFLSAMNYIVKPPVLSPDFTGIDTLPPTHLLMFVSPHCPHCPSTLQKLLPIVWLNSDIHLKIMDVGLFPKQAEMHGIQSVPAVIYKNFQWTGSIQIAEIVDVIINDPDQWEPETLQRMLSEGKADQLAKIILEKGTFIENFDQLIAHELLSVRLGAMVCVEYIADENFSLAQNLCDKIWQMIPKANLQVQGDLIYLMGICGTVDHITPLKQLKTKLTDDDIQDAINEALETIQERVT
ncbi:NADH dehydrogenase [Candidatus Magnetomorum sp. HK-1]|nr:NADH dehydrogenase [Candidatus Magnetomorum sp. HK-1]